MRRMEGASAQGLAASASDVPAEGTLVGRMRRKGRAHPSVVTVREGSLVDITSREAPTVRDVCELEDPASHVSGADGEAVCGFGEIAGAGTLLAPVDLQVVKAAGVTFAASMLERVIEEQARGDPDKAAGIRERVTELIGPDLGSVRPGSEQAAEVKRLLIERGAWSQYLEVGIGPHPEVFTKAPPMAAVGHLADVGINPISSWNNPEPEAVLAVSSAGRAVGATLGNDVNLRDVEGLSALLLGKAKDNNASCALGPFVRLFDGGFGIDAVRSAVLSLEVRGKDGFVLEGSSSMELISRDPLDLVAATCGDFHQYPDGFVLMLGTMFAPVEDRDEPDQGFTHKAGDVVSISCPELGELRNRVLECRDCPPWDYGAASLMRELSAAGLL